MARQRSRISGWRRSRSFASIKNGVRGRLRSERLSSIDTSPSRLDETHARTRYSLIPSTMCWKSKRYFCGEIGFGKVKKKQMSDRSGRQSGTRLRVGVFAQLIFKLQELSHSLRAV